MVEDLLVSKNFFHGGSAVALADFDDSYFFIIVQTEEKLIVKTYRKVIERYRCSVQATKAHGKIEHGFTYSASTYFEDSRTCLYAIDGKLHILLFNVFFSVVANFCSHRVAFA